MVENSDQLISSSLPSHTGKVDNVSTLLVKHVREESLKNKNMKMKMIGRKP